MQSTQIPPKTSLFCLSSKSQKNIPLIPSTRPIKSLVQHATAPHLTPSNNQNGPPPTSPLSHSHHRPTHSHPPPFSSNTPTLPHPIPQMASSSSPSLRRLPPPIWSHDETLALIESYRRKHHSLRRANLRAADWDDVASDLSRRSPLLPSKTPVQCRHKIEKLRQRFRADRRRSLDRNPQSPPASAWPFFPLMESLDGPPVPDPEPMGFVIPKAVRTKIVSPGSGVGKMKAAGLDDVGVKPVVGEMRRRMERKRKETEMGTADGVVVAMRMVGDGFMRLERVRLDMVREMGKMRMEMELKRTEMVLDSQQRIVDAFVKGVVGGVRRKKGKVCQDSRVSDE